MSESAPSRQLQTDGLDTNRAVSKALEEVQAHPDRDGTGRFVRGNTAAGSTLARSEALWQALSDAKRELVGQLRSDLAIDNGDAAATMEGLLDAYAEARLLRHSMFIRLIELGGPITAKGKARALFTTYLKALDRERRLALDLGLQRRSKPVSVGDYVREQADQARATREAEHRSTDGQNLEAEPSPTGRSATGGHHHTPSDDGASEPPVSRPCAVLLPGIEREPTDLGRPH